MHSPFVSVLFSFIIASCFLFQINQALITLPKNIRVPAVIAFGDSIIDPGNNNHLLTMLKCNFPPYGKDLNEGIPTGRWSNGKIPTDIVVEEFGIKELLPAYLDPTLQPQDLLTGVSFASGGSGYDPLTAKLVSVLSMTQQMDFFKEYMMKLKQVAGEEKTRTIIAESFYVICAGSNDIANTYFTFPFRRRQYDVGAYTNLMVDSASKFIQELYGLGARRIAVFTVPPVGCVPMQRTLTGGEHRECAEEQNQAALLFNSKLSSLIDSLNKKLPQSKITSIDIYKALLDLIQNPNSYGFVDVRDGCCGTGRTEFSILCHSVLHSTCANNSQYLFWDSFHPTETAYRFLSNRGLRENINHFF